ncbi:MAG: HlyC/CorC family transporter [Brumimicrobium sp.]|nr:HlyC/CorC family transporter [Brumimicrobium sp.]
MEILIIIGLILLNGIFSMAEMSLVSSRRFKLEKSQKKGHKGAKAALKLTDKPTRFLSTIQIGITLIGILLGIYSGDSLVKNFAGYLDQFVFLQGYSHKLATVIIVCVVTYFSIVLGELLPKRLGMTFPESIASTLAIPMKILSILTSPFVWLLTASNEVLLKLLGINSKSKSKVSEEEIKSIIKDSADGGEIQDIERDIVERIFELGDRKVNSLFTYRRDIIYFTIEDTLDEIKSKINQEKHSAYPVTKDNNIDDIIGIVLLKDLFTHVDDVDFNIINIIREPLYFTESTFAYKVLESFKKEKIHYGIIVDEFGLTQGIVTMDDVVDALVGDMSEIDQYDYQITQRNENSWLVDGQYPIIDFLKYFEIELEDQHKRNYTTVAGLLIHNLQNLPDIGQKIIIDNYELEIIDKDGQRIDKIMVSKNSPRS